MNRFKPADVFGIAKRIIPVGGVIDSHAYAHIKPQTLRPDFCVSSYTTLEKDIDNYTEVPILNKLFTPDD